MANVNQFPGLSRGPIDHKDSSVINAIANDKIDMGAAVELIPPTIRELLPRVVEHTSSQGSQTYGIAVGGDNDGVYGSGLNSVDDSTRATSAAGQSVVVVTQGRCLAKVKSVISTGVVVVGSKLTTVGSNGQLELAQSGDLIIATALQKVDISVDSTSTDMIAIDVQQGGVSA